MLPPHHYCIKQQNIKAVDLDVSYNSTSQHMHSATGRLNNITIFTGTVLGFMCVLNFFQGYFSFNPKTPVSFQITSMVNFIPTSKWEQASFKYSLAADFSKLYNWNLKQLYVYVECQWEHPSKNLTSRTIVSDFILEIPPSKADLQQIWTVNVTNTRMDYLVRDVHSSLRGAALKFSVNVEYMPIVGFFFKARLFQTQYQMPNLYSNSGEK